MDRKGFIQVCGMACLGGSAILTLMEGCGSSNYFAQFVLADKQITIKKTEFLALEKPKSNNEAVRTVQRKFVLLKSEQFNFPICIYKTAEDNYTALLMECTHKGCELKPHGDYLICPCHGSEFSNKGMVQNPPAEDNLKTFQTKTDYENIYILL